MTVQQKDNQASHAPAPAAWVRTTGVLVATVVGLGVVALLWNQTSAAVAPSAMRLFLITWLAAGVATVSAYARMLPVPPALRLGVVGMAVGAALASTAWGQLALPGWWQLWITVPLLVAQIPLHTIRDRT